MINVDSALSCDHFKSVMDPSTSRSFKLCARDYIEVYVCIYFRVYSVFDF